MQVVMLCVSSSFSEVAGLFLINPLSEGLFLDSRKGETADSAESDAKPRTWSEYWMRYLTPRWTGVWISAAVGFNRLSLMVGLTSPVEEPELSDLLPHEVVLRKVSEENLSMEVSIFLTHTHTHTHTPPPAEIPDVPA